MTATGHCLCGKIRFSATGDLRPILHCHCDNCRRATGNFVAASGCATDDLTVEDPEERLAWFDLGYARYGFCSICGSHMFWQGAEHMDRISLQAGVLDDVSALPLAGIWFVDEAQSHALLDDSIPQYAGNGDDSP